MSRSTHSVVGAVVGAVLLAGTIPPSQAAAAAARPDQVQAPVPTISWAACTDGGPGLCATARAPLDYDRPTGPTVVLDLRKIPAADQARRIGSLFVNPGGPGGSATSFVPWARLALGATVAQRYDVIGVDPRGVGRHSQMVCSNDNPPPPYPRTFFPVTVADSKVHWRAAVFARSACTRDPNAITLHMSTADTARDMDLIRQAVGDRQLFYYGISYGTQLGSTYASMFPSRAGRMVLDAVLDPVAWSTGGPANLPATQPFSTRLRSAKGAYEAMTSAMRECDRVGPAQCDFAPGAPKKWLTLVDLARAGKLTAGGRPLSYPDLIGGILGFLYGNVYTPMDAVLQQLWEENTSRDGARVDARAAALLRQKASIVSSAPYMTPAGRATKVSDAFMGVACADTRNPDTRQAWWNAGRSQDRRYPWFGSMWTWVSAPCATYPIKTKTDTWFGPYGGRTANPILIVGNTYDPATPLHGAQAVDRLFTNSRLLRYDGWGHGAIGTRCVTAAFDRYYATGALPAVGAVCGMDQGLWAGGAG